MVGGAGVVGTGASMGPDYSREMGTELRTWHHGIEVAELQERLGGLEVGRPRSTRDDLETERR